MILKSIFFEKYKSIFLLAFPMILSQGIQTILLLIDRHFLAFKNPILTCVATTSGFTALSFNMFFIYCLSFATSLIGKDFGKNDIKSCQRILTQCFLLSSLFVPIIIFLSSTGNFYFKCLGHSSEYRELENAYFFIIMLSYIPILYKTSLESYLLGIGRSKDILIANILGLVTNSVCCYLFVIGSLEHFFTGATGAAWATFFSNSFAFLFLMIKSTWKLNTEFLFKNFKTLLSQGSFTGLEKFVNSFCFVLFVNMFVSYGPDINLAVTIIFTWDQIAFLPLMGIYAAVMSLYSRYLGKNDYKEASLILHQSLQLTLMLMSVFAIFFWLFSDQLIQTFFHSSNVTLNILHVKKVGMQLFKTTCFYIFIQSFTFIYKAALRSLGLSFWCFRCSLIIHVLLVLSSYIGIYVLHVSYLQVWGYFMIMQISLAIAFVLKFYLFHKNLIKESLPSSANNKYSKNNPLFYQDQ